MTTKAQIRDLTMFEEDIIHRALDSKVMDIGQSQMSIVHKIPRMGRDLQITLIMRRCTGEHGDDGNSNFTGGTVDFAGPFNEEASGDW
ncbi:hypothetical protein KY289_026935 [Solanum tuberosum]|nr:hypothetical protein KY289_026935 [Solanum tuberosum]